MSEILELEIGPNASLIMKLAAFSRPNWVCIGDSGKTEMVIIKMADNKDEMRWEHAQNALSAHLPT